MYELHLEETPGAVEVWVVLVDDPVEIVRCYDGPSIRQAVNRLREKYAIEPEGDVVTFANEAEVLEELRELQQQTQNRKRQRMEREAQRQAERKAYREWFERTGI